MKSTNLLLKTMAVLIFLPSLAWAQNIVSPITRADADPLEVNDTFDIEVSFQVPTSVSSVRNFQLGIGYDATVLEVQTPLTNIFSLSQPLTCDPNEPQSVPIEGYSNVIICSQGFLETTVTDPNGWLPIVGVTFKVLQSVPSTTIKVLKNYVRNNDGSTQETYITDANFIRVINSATANASTTTVTIAGGGAEDCTDGDGDGYVPSLPYTNCSLPQGDCDDGNANRFPGNPEIHDQIDNDCNASTSDPNSFPQITNFTATPSSGTGSLTVNTFSVTVEDADNDNLNCTFHDGVGAEIDFIATSTSGGFTKSNFPSRTYSEGNYTATVSCDDAPYNGDDSATTSITVSPEGCANDNDVDGYGSPPTAGCFTQEEDCNDNNANINPGVSRDIHDTVDNDCDGQIDEDNYNPSIITFSASPAISGTSSLEVTQFTVRVNDDDNDDLNCTFTNGDGYTTNFFPSGNALPVTKNDFPSHTYSIGDYTATVSCNDLPFNGYHEAEINIIVNDPGCIDQDGDGFGNPITDCTKTQLDCNDGNNEIFPGAEEVLDNVDNNCDGQIDEGLVDEGSTNQAATGNTLEEVNVSSGGCTSSSSSLSFLLLTSLLGLGYLRRKSRIEIAA